MAFTVDNPVGNQITITNTDTEDPINYTIAILGNDGEFEDLTNYIDQTIDEDSSVTIDLIDDGIFSITVDDNIYYDFVNSNIRACEKIYLQRLLCNPCDDCKNTLKDIQADIRFRMLSERFYYIANKYRQDQSVVDLISPENAELLYWTDILAQLTRICDTCYTNGDYTSCNICGSTDDCGCSN